MLGREVVEGQQGLAILGQASRGLVVLGPTLDDKAVERGIVGRKVAAHPDGAAQLGVQGLDSVRGVDDPADIVGKRRTGSPRASAGARTWRSPGICAPIRPRQRPPGPRHRRRHPWPCRCPSGPPRPPCGPCRTQIERVADQMHDAGLDLGLREHGGDRVGKAFQAVTTAITISSSCASSARPSPGSQNFAPAGSARSVSEAAVRLAHRGGLLDPQPCRPLPAPPCPGAAIPAGRRARASSPCAR